MPSILFVFILYLFIIDDLNKSPVIIPIALCHENQVEKVKTDQLRSLTQFFEIFI